VFARRNGLGRPRLGLAVSRKAAPRAVDRNYAKRIAREVFRQRQAALGGADIVVRLRRPISRREGAAAREELAALMQRMAPCHGS
jgi:ribonuclease P protein component